jgi:DNA polymerase-3 subunit epsilon
VKNEPSLVRQAVTLLQQGEVHTLDLARKVLGLSGNPGAASSAVFSLLGSDPRFQVDPGGRWSLAGDVGPREEDLESLAFAVVDVETTGGSPDRGHRMTEIAVVEIRDGMICRDFQTLLNPGRAIPPRIAGLTGITDAMVAPAPFFEDIAEDLLHRLEGRVFVAHNAPFDWRFVSSQLGDAIGHVPRVPKLCTVQLARRLTPELRRRNLDALTAHFGIPVHPRHRAYGDALATARVLLRLLDEARSRGVRDLAALQLLSHRKGLS